MKLSNLLGIAWHQLSTYIVSGWFIIPHILIIRHLAWMDPCSGTCRCTVYWAIPICFLRCPFDAFRHPESQRGTAEIAWNCHVLKSFKTQLFCLCKTTCFFPFYKHVVLQVCAVCLTTKAWLNLSTVAWEFVTPTLGYTTIRLIVESGIQQWPYQTVTPSSYFAGHFMLDFSRISRTCIAKLFWDP